VPSDRGQLRCAGCTGRVHAGMLTREHVLGVWSRVQSEKQRLREQAITVTGDRPMVQPGYPGLTVVTRTDSGKPAFSGCRLAVPLKPTVSAAHMKRIFIS
jgi:hypothetical protein